MVTVGVNVSGVLVDVANMFCVGMGVSVGARVKVAVAGGGVGVARTNGMFGSPAQPERDMKVPANARSRISFFIMKPLCSSPMD